MKQAFCIFLSMAVFTPIVAPAEAVDMLDHRINELTQQRDALRAELDACKQNTQKFKVAGIATLGATGLGVVGNIALHNKIQNMGGASKSVVVGGVVADVRTEENKADYECEELYCPMDREGAMAMGCEC